jgi:hypothetical protein
LKTDLRAQPGFLFNTAAAHSSEFSHWPLPFKEARRVEKGAALPSMLDMHRVGAPDLMDLLPSRAFVLPKKWNIFDIFSGNFVPGYR